MQDAQRAFAVLAVEPWGGSALADQVTASFEQLPGVGALWVDAGRQRIHVLYDGTAATIELVENAVRIPGHRIHLLSPNNHEGIHL